jgi:hypothetical protein
MCLSRKTTARMKLPRNGPNEKKAQDQRPTRKVKAGMVIDVVVAYAASS